MAIKHGHACRGARSATYRTWLRMVKRCHNPKDKDFRKYGGRGISVCIQWRESFETFLSDMGERPSGTSIDRINNDGNYEPGNCSWATAKEQMRNRTITVTATLNGVTKPLAEWGENLGLKLDTLLDRRRHGWGDERMLTTPVTRRWAADGRSWNSVAPGDKCAKRSPEERRAKKREYMRAFRAGRNSASDFLTKTKKLVREQATQRAE